MSRPLVWLMASLAIGSMTLAAQAAGPAGGFFGIGLDTESVKGEGVGVFAVYPGGPAEIGGLRVGDKVLSLDGEDVSSLTAAELAARLGEHKIGDVVVVGYRRGEELQQVELKAIEQPRSVARASRTMKQQQAMARGIEEFVGLMRLGDVFEISQHPEGAYFIESVDREDSRLSISDDLMTFLRHLHPLGESLREMKAGDRIRFKGTVSGNRISAELLGPPPEKPAGDPDR